MSIFKERLSKNQATPVYLVEITAGEILKTWRSVQVEGYSGSAWAFEIGYQQRPSEVLVEGAAITPVTGKTRLAVAQDVTSIGAWSQEEATLFLVLPNGSTPWNRTIQAIVPFYFSTHPKVFDNKYYEPRVLSLPNLSLRIEAQFGGVAQIGGGSLNLNNGDGIFSRLQHLNWDYGRTVLRAGIDLPGDPMPISNYEVFGSWLNDGYDCNADSFSIQLTEQKTRLQKRLSSALYAVDSHVIFGVIDPKLVGKPVPTCYGSVRGATPTQFDLSGSATFHVAGHRIKSFSRFQFLEGDVWRDIPSNFLTLDGAYTPDISTATFKLTSDFVANHHDLKLSVDFQGKVNDVGLYLENAADIVLDILASVGETKVNMASFEESRNRLEIGTDTFTGQKIYRSPISLYLNEQVTALDVLEKINEAVGSYLYVGLDGLYHYRVFQPLAGDAALGTGNELPVLTEEIIQSFDMSIDSDVISQVVGTYDERKAEDAVATYEVHRDSVLLVHGLPAGAHNTESSDLPFTEGKDATYWVERTLAMRSVPARTISVSLHWTGILYEPTSQVVVRYKKHGYEVDDVFEVLEQAIDLKSNSVKLVLGDRHGFQHVGHWTMPDYAAVPPEGASPTKLPTQFSELAGYGADGAATIWNTNWASEIKEWARRHVAYAVDASGMANASDPDSFNLPPLLPERFQGLVGYGNGSAASWQKGWAPEIKAWARQNLAFWSDENGFAMSNDPESFMLTRWF